MQLNIYYAVERLNEMLACDPQAIGTLVETRVPCNQTLLNHPRVTCIGPDEDPTVGLLGILNGLFGKESIRIAAIYDDERVTGFKVISRPPA